jgi:hypothetical protein
MWRICRSTVSGLPLKARVSQSQSQLLTTLPAQASAPRWPRPLIRI